MLKRACRFSVALAILAGCSTIEVDLPAISETATGQRETGRIVWHDLITTTPEASRKFYGELFGWTFERPRVVLGFGSADSYMLIRHNGRLIGGMFDARKLEKEENISQWITVVSSDDIDAATAAVRAAGGEVLTEPTSLPTRGSMGVYADTSGAIFALVQTRDGDPEYVEPEINGFLWTELWTDDVPGSVDFYGRVLGLGHDVHSAGDVDYKLLKRGDQPAAGILEHPFEGERPVWANYLRVEDPAAITARVESLGGRVVVDAQPRSIGGSVAVILGPSGAGIALQTWPIKENEE